MTNLTKKAICEAFMNMLEERQLKQITIREITKESGLNRNTFYYHFKDIPDLIEYILIEEWNDCTGNYMSIYGVENLFSVLTRRIVERKNAILHIYKSVSREVFERYLWKICEHITTAVLKSEGNADDIDERSYIILYQYIKGTLFGILMEWLECDLESDFNDNMWELCIAKKGDLYGLIKKCGLY